MMKNNRTFRRHIDRQSRRRHSALSLESLEHRHLLAANVLASVEDSITASSPTDDIEMSISMPTAGADQVTLMFHMTAIDGALDPAAPVIRSSTGAIVTPISAMDDADGTDSMTVATMGAGEYTIETSAEGGSTGRYTLEVSLLGDVDSADSRVMKMERLQASAALIQASGSSNHITQLFFAQQGIDLTVDQYDEGFDANMNGEVDGFEVGIVEDNEAAGVAIVELQSDVDGPTVSSVGLVNDTGTSNSDNITTDVRISGRVQDENVVTQVSLSVDGGPSVDVTSQLGDLDASSGFFTLTRSILEDVIGGSLTPGAHSVSISGVDEFENETSSPGTLNFVLIENNAAPTTSGPFSGSATEELPFSFDTSGFFSDANPGDALTFSATGLPAWLSITPSGFFQGTPGNDDVGEAIVTVTATDSQGLNVSTTATITITNVPDSPVITPIADRTAEDDTLFSLDLSTFISDADAGDVVTVSVDQADGVDGSGNPINLRPLPDWLSYDETTMVLSGTPTDAEVGDEINVFVLAVDQGGLSDSELFTITVQDLNDPPELVGEIPDDTIDEGDSYSLDLNSFFTDPDVNDSLRFTAELSNATPLPSWLNLNLTTGVFSGIPDDPEVGMTFEIVATATDQMGASISDTYMLTVNNVNDAPVVNDGDFNILPTDPAGTVVGTIDFSDEDVGDTVTITFEGGNGNFDVDPSTGVITVSANASLMEGDVFDLDITATDLDGATGTGTVTITASANQAPVAMNDNPGFETFDIETFSIFDADLLANDTDADGDTLTVSSVDSSSTLGATITMDGNDIIYNPRLVDALLELRPGESMEDTFTYTVADGNGGFDTATVTINVVGTDSVEFALRTFDLQGNEVGVVQPGEEFELRVFTQDIRPDSQGVFAPFVDVTYDDDLASVVPSDPPGNEIVPSSTYNTVPEGDASTPGLLDEVGGLGALSPIGDGEFEVFRVRMQAGNTPGVINFASDMADEPNLHVVLVYLDDDPVASQQIIFGSTSLTIAGPIPPLSGNVPGTNFNNPMDTNDDAFVSAMDALVVINAMENGRSNLYPDVNADTLVSAMDALMVVNYLAGATPQAPLSASESATESAIESVGSVGLPTLEAGNGAQRAAGNALPNASPRIVDDTGLAIWSAAESSEITVGEAAEETSLVDSIFAELGS